MDLENDSWWAANKAFHVNLMLGIPDGAMNVTIEKPVTEIETKAEGLTILKEFDMIVF